MTRGVTVLPGRCSHLHPSKSGSLSKMQRMTPYLVMRKFFCQRRDVTAVSQLLDLPESLFAKCCHVWEWWASYIGARNELRSTFVSKVCKRLREAHSERLLFGRPMRAQKPGLPRRSDVKVEKYIASTCTAQIISPFSISIRIDIVPRECVSIADLGSGCADKLGAQAHWVFWREIKVCRYAMYRPQSSVERLSTPTFPAVSNVPITEVFSVTQTLVIQHTQSPNRTSFAEHIGHVTPTFWLQRRSKSSSLLRPYTCRQKVARSLRRARIVLALSLATLPPAKSASRTLENYALEFPPNVVVSSRHRWRSHCVESGKVPVAWANVAIKHSDVGGEIESPDAVDFVSSSALLTRLPESQKPIKITCVYHKQRKVTTRKGDAAQKPHNLRSCQN